MKRYQVNEVFYSVQGEGARAGTANIFVRFSGCNLSCSRDGEAGFDCDTEFVSGTPMSLESLLGAISTASGDSGCEWVLLTGGEPALQADEDLIEALHSRGYKVAIETNGTVALPANLSDSDWICVSPKTAEHTLRVESADEVKYVRHAGQGIPRPRVAAPNLLISPAFESLAGPDGSIRHRPHPAALAWCLDLVKRYPEWRLSVQLHKTWGIR